MVSDLPIPPHPQKFKPVSSEVNATRSNVDEIYVIGTKDFGIMKQRGGLGEGGRLIIVWLGQDHDVRVRSSGVDGILQAANVVGSVIETYDVMLVHSVCIENQTTISFTITWHRKIAYNLWIIFMVVPELFQHAREKVSLQF